MKTPIKTVALNLSLSLFALVLLMPASSQAGEFQKKHPRRAEVLKRDKNEVDKNNQDAVDGKITDKQAQRLDRKDAKIKKEEQADAAKNGGHITKAEQRKLNREENQVNRDRRRDERRDARKGAAPGAGAPAAPTQPVAPPTSN